MTLQCKLMRLLLFIIILFPASISLALDPTKNFVKISGEPTLKFALKTEPKVQAINGKVNLAFTSESDSLFQITGMPVPDSNTRKTILKQGEYRLILMGVPSIDGALVSKADSDSNVEIVKQSDGSFTISGKGRVFHQSSVYSVNFSAHIRIPDNRQISTF